VEKETVETSNISYFKRRIQHSTLRRNKNFHDASQQKRVIYLSKLTISNSRLFFRSAD